MGNALKNPGESAELKITWDPSSSIRTDILETFPYEGRTQLIMYSTREFSAVCPFSGLPDLASVIIEYIPGKKCAELKSLKLYFISFRNVGIYQEAVTDRIFSDLWDILSPQWLKIKTEYETRGGIDAVCVIEDGIKPDPSLGTDHKSN